jgi:radical SAM protein with 4Fe4S-binding SPASM domain
MAEVARNMGIPSVSIVPYYYFTACTGKNYEEELMSNFNCHAFSWKGFHHENSGIDFEIFLIEFRKYLSDLGTINNFEYMPMTENDYRIWFRDSSTPVCSTECMSVEKLIDVQPNGDANFCVDFPDYSFGNVKTSSIKDLWNSKEAQRFRRFREFRRKKPLAVCCRCGAKYMAELI